MLKLLTLTHEGIYLKKSFYGVEATIRTCHKDKGLIQKIRIKQKKEAVGKHSFFN